jgi:two-component system C4-dicarboxylate transport sensor histidine kinase DctB
VQYLDRGASDRAADNMHRISDMARRMGRIIRNLRAFARQETGRPERIELGEVLNTALELTSSHRADAGVDLIYAPPAQPLWVRGGEVRLSQVFVNLITNAIDAMADSDAKTLRIEVRENETVSVVFRDSGPGIEMPDKVFDPFYTTKSGSDTAGMGLGLSISYGIVQSLGGQIRGTNADEGGAEFTVTLDHATPEAAAA